ncbi:MAG: hypothetical protein IJ679_00800, partial [Lachnospiraceae bacterium]|nr:hypothetical protein [Lachnospiraceae bacterium]
LLMGEATMGITILYPNSNARFSSLSGSKSVKFDEDPASKAAWDALVSGNQNLNAGDVTNGLKFTYGNSSFQISYTSLQDHTSSDFRSGQESFTVRVSVEGKFSAVNPSAKTTEREVHTPTPQTKSITTYSYETFGPRAIYEEAEYKKKDNKSVGIQKSSEVSDRTEVKIDELSNRILGIEGLDVRTEWGATDAIDRAEKALSKLSATRSRIGAQQNRLEHSIKINEISSEDTSAAESRIRDTDVAEEVVNYVKSNLLENVSQSMLAQANQNGSQVLSILGTEGVG